MGSSAEHGETLLSKGPLDRRAFGLGLAQRPALLIGADILCRFSNITLDFGRSRMRFSGPRAKTPGSRAV